MNNCNAVLSPLLAAIFSSFVAAQELRIISPPILHRACFDPVRQRVVAPGTGGFSHEWDGTSWRQAPDAGAQPGFCFVEAATGRLVSIREADWLVGGTLAFDISVRIGNRWQALPQSTGPSWRWGMSLAYDAARGEVLAFGGSDMATGALLADTWVFDGSAWVQRTPGVSPSPRTYPSLTFDSTRQRVVAFGGFDTGPLDDTWEWDGSTWQVRTLTARPPARFLAPTAFDAARGRVVLVGGGTGQGQLIDTWEFDGTNWTQRAAPPVPVPCILRALVYDAAHGEILLLGHAHSDPQNGATWAWNGSSWVQRGNVGASPMDSSFAACAGPTGATVLQFGGINGSSGPSAPVDHLWEFDGQDWALLAAGGPPPRSNATAWSMAGSMFVFGGDDAQGVLFGDTWQWDGVGWTPLGAGPSPRRFTAAVHAVAQGRTVLFGGEASGATMGDTWTFDGIAWQAVATSVAPPARQGHSLAYDPVRDRVVLYGGITPGFPHPIQRHDTWEWDGSAWHFVPIPIAPPSVGMMAFDSIRQRIVFAEASRPSGANLLWEYDGVAWTQLSITGPVAGFGSPVAVTGPHGSACFVTDHGVYELLNDPARVANYGGACGIGAPTLGSSTLPRLGDIHFAIEMTACPSNAPVVILAADTRASLPFLGCTLLVALGQASLLVTSSAQGFVALPLPIPTATGLLGQDYCFQGAALAPTAPIGFVLSDGLHIRLGR